jgi:hypothetical protein
VEAHKMASTAKQVIPVLPEYMAEMLSNKSGKASQSDQSASTYKEGQLVRFKLDIPCIIILLYERPAKGSLFGSGWQRMRINDDSGRLYWFVLPRFHSKLLWYEHSLKGEIPDNKDLLGIIQLQVQTATRHPCAIMQYYMRDFLAGLASIDFGYQYRAQ